MAFGPGTTTGTDLTRKGSLKAQWPEGKLPEDLRVSPEYHAFAKEQDEKLKVQAFDDHQRSMRAAESGNAGDLAGRIAHGAAAHVDLRAEAQKEEKKREEAFRDFVMREQLRRIEADLAHYRERIRTLQEYQNALQRHIEKLKNGDEIEKNVDGSLKDKQAEEAIRAYEKEHGVSIDRDDIGQISEVLQVHKENEKDYREKYKHSTEEYAELQQQAEKIGMSSTEEAVKIDKDILRGRGINEAAEILSQAENEKIKAEIIASRGFDRNYEEATLDAAKGDIFSDTEIGSQNPFSKGDISGSFSKQAAVESTDKITVQPINAIPRGPTHTTG